MPANRRSTNLWPSTRTINFSLGYELQPRRTNSGGSVVAIKRADGETLFNPNADTNLEAGETLIVVGPSGLSTRLERLEKG